MTTLETRLARPVALSKLNSSALNRGKPSLTGSNSLIQLKAADKAINLGGKDRLLNRIAAENKAVYENQSGLSVRRSRSFRSISALRSRLSD